MQLDDNLGRGARYLQQLIQPGSDLHKAVEQLQPEELLLGDVDRVLRSSQLVAGGMVGTLKNLSQGTLCKST